MPMSDKDSSNEVGTHMSPDLQHQYLKAMGIQVWQSRFQTEVEVQYDANSLKDAIPLKDKVDDIESQNEQDEVISDWSKLKNTVDSCVACELHQSKVQTVVSEGSHLARLMFISTAPAINAESVNHLLKPESSQLFTKMLNAIEVSREDIYFTSLLKCQLPQSRELRTTEILCCQQYLTQQIEMLNPSLIVALGETVAQELLVSKKSLTELSDKAYQYHSIPLMVMAHPDDLLSNPEDKRQAWSTLQQIKQKLCG